ncbi:hypothetical protein [Verrucosispora sp. NA02020]|uniref:hypothetical protein n=1 Tax=Verrucosispora sp. NA02020 TaxID=2742132 RepID=UPI0020CA5EA9|nr:hypothetical protein [Verrucosispora sp. NA02020]
MRRLLLDSNAIDPFADVPGAYEAAEKAVVDGSHELIFTHVNVDELAETPDVDRRQHLLLVMVGLGRLVPTGATAVGYSRVSWCRVVDDADVFDAVQSGNIDHTRDALLAATAVFERCPLVTNDKKLRNRATGRGVQVFTTTELLAELGVTVGQVG